METIRRSVVPLLGLTLLAMFAVLYAVHTHAYYRALTTIGVNPTPYPFVDWEYIAAGIRCWNNNIDVYIEDPCDVGDRPHAYSPLWLRAVFIPTDTIWTMPIGISIVLAFMSSLFWFIKPANWPELIVFVLACTSTMVVFALERGNVDVILFIMLVVAGVLSTGSLASRILSYFLILLAGLLKFYPLIVLLTALRERPRTFLAIAAAVGLIVVGFFYRFRSELAAALKNTPSGGYASDLFGAVNLPFNAAGHALRLFPGLEQFAWFTMLPYTILAILIIVTSFQAIQLARSGNLVAIFAKTPDRDVMFLTIGAALIVGCFFAGQNVGYRGVYLIFIVAGLVAMRRVADPRTRRATLTPALIIVIFLMWEGLFRHALRYEVAGPGRALFVLFWLIREVLWWRLVALLLAVLTIFGVRSKVFAALKPIGGLHRRQSHLQG